MATTPTIPRNGVSILSRLMRPNGRTLPATAARAILKIDFDESDRERMRELSTKAREGSLSAEEKTEIDSYELVGHMLGLMHSLARQALKKRNRTSA